MHENERDKLRKKRWRAWKNEVHLLRNGGSLRRQLYWSRTFERLTMRMWKAQKRKGVAQ